MRYTEFIIESPATELAKKLPSLDKHDYDTIDKLMSTVAKRHSITGKALHDLFIKKYHRSPDDWIKSKLDENTSLDIQDEVDKFCNWACQKLKIKTKP